MGLADDVKPSCHCTIKLLQYCIIFIRRWGGRCGFQPFYYYTVALRPEHRESMSAMSASGRSLIGAPHIPADGERLRPPMLPAPPAPSCGDRGKQYVPCSLLWHQITSRWLRAPPLTFSILRLLRTDSNCCLPASLCLVVPLRYGICQNFNFSLGLSCLEFRIDTDKTYIVFELPNFIYTIAYGL